MCGGWWISLPQGRDRLINQLFGRRFMQSWAHSMPPVLVVLDAHVGKAARKPLKQVTILRHHFDGKLFDSSASCVSGFGGARTRAEACFDHAGGRYQGLFTFEVTRPSSLLLG